MDLELFDEVANPTGRAEAFKDIEAKVRIMNRAHEARDLLRSFPDDVGTTAVLAAYGAVLRHLAEVYDRHPDYQRRWWPEDI